MAVQCSKQGDLVDPWYRLMHLVIMQGEQQILRQFGFLDASAIYVCLTPFEHLP